MQLFHAEMKGPPSLLQGRHRTCRFPPDEKTAGSTEEHVHRPSGSPLRAPGLCVVAYSIPLHVWKKQLKSHRADDGITHSPPTTPARCSTSVNGPSATFHFLLSSQPISSLSATPISWMSSRFSSAITSSPTQDGLFANVGWLQTQDWLALAS